MHKWQASIPLAGRIYPNPTDGLVRIELNAPLSRSATVHVIDMQGRYVLRNQTPLAAGNNTVSLNLASLHSGIYFIEVRDDKNILGKYKVVKR